MSIIDFTNTPAATPSARRPFAGQSSQSDQPAAQLWMNLGYDVVTDNGTVFINLPFGLPIDTMRPIDIRGQNEDWIMQQHARNELLANLQKAGANLAPGEQVEVKLTIKLLRRKEELKVEGKPNGYAVDFTSMFKEAAE